MQIVAVPGTLPKLLESEPSTGKDHDALHTWVGRE